MPVKSIVVGWDLDKIADQEESFEKGFTAVFSQANGKKPDFVTDPDHIRFVSEKEEIDHLVEQGLCDIIVCSETLSGDANIGFGTLKQWKAGGVQKIILILDDSKYAKGKVKSLYDNGFYDMLYVKDFKGRGLISLLLGGRNRDQAYEYYGLENYKDLFTEQEGKKDKNRNNSKDSKEAGAAKKEPGKRKSRKGDSGEPEVKEKRRAPEKESAKTSEKRKRSKKGDKENSPDAEVVAFDNENVATFLDKGVSLNSSKDIIKRQRAIGRTMYAIKKPKEADFSKDVTAFLKPGMEPLQYIRAMETATHVDLSDREKALNHKDAILEEILDYYTTKDNTWMNNLRQHLTDRASWDAELRQRISTYGITSGISDGVQDEIFKEFNDFMFGYDFLGDLIRDPDVTDIKVLNYDSVLVKRKGKRVPEDRTFRSPEHYTAFISHLTKRNHVNIQNNAAVKFMDTKCFKEARLRVNIQTEYINCSGIPSLHIRKENNVKYSTDDLVNAGMMTYDTASYLIYEAREDTGILFVGGNGQGKTSLFNWLLDFIPYTATGQCLQESDELFSQTHKYIQFLQVTDDEEENFADGQGKYDLRRLSAIGLKTDNDYFMIGEITGAEAKYFINYVYTGSRCWASVHGMSAKAGLPKIADYGMYDTDYTVDQLLEMLVALKVIVYIEDFQIKEILEVAGWDSENKDIIYKNIPIVVPEKPDRDEDVDGADKKAG